MKLKLNLNSLLAVLLLVFVVLGCNRSRKTTNSNSNQNSSSSSAPLSGDEIAAEDLFDEFQKDKDAAESKYKGKVIVVRGTVDTTKTEGTSPYITMKTSSLILRVQCIFPKSETSAVSGLSKGQTIRVRGKVFGRIGNVVLQDCEVL